MANPKGLFEITEADVKAAEGRMAERRRSTPQAVAAIYDRRIGRIVIRLNTGLELAFPPSLAEGLEHARASDLVAIEISPTGLGLHFPCLDADIYVPALLDGVFGSEGWTARRLNGPARRKRKPAAEPDRRSDRSRKAAAG